MQNARILQTIVEIVQTFNGSSYHILVIFLKHQLQIYKSLCPVHWQWSLVCWKWAALNAGKSDAMIIKTSLNYVLSITFPVLRWLVLPWNNNKVEFTWSNLRQLFNFHRSAVSMPCNYHLAQRHIVISWLKTSQTLWLVVSSGLDYRMGSRGWSPGPPQLERPPSPGKNAVKAVFTNYAEIQAALNDIGSDSKQSLDTRVQANALA